MLVLALSGIGFVEELERLGLKTGNKVRNQVGIPDWILKDKQYSRLCLRGLMDTDGGVYFHKHKVNGKRYINFGLCFTNHSRPIILSVAEILKENNFKFSIEKSRKIYIYALNEIKKYFELINSSNPKHLKRFNDYLNLIKK